MKPTLHALLLSLIIVSSINASPAAKVEEKQLKPRTAIAANCVTDTTQGDFLLGTPTGTDVAASPGDVVLLNPVTPDQQNTTLSPGGPPIDIVNWGGQTFTAGLNGQLTNADINLSCFSCIGGTAPNLTLSVRATSAGLPTGADLAVATLTGNPSGTASNFAGTFGTPLPVTAGTVYALVVRPVANPSNPGSHYVLTQSATDAYSPGQRVASPNSGGTWVGSPTDAGFHTFIKPGFNPGGDFVSASKDANPAGLTPIWSTISWTATTPANTTLKFQAAASNAAGGPFNFVGPDGTAGTFWTTSGAPPLDQFYGMRYLQYKAFFNTSDPSQTPTLNDVTVCFNNVDCSGAISITPSPAQVCANSTGNTASGPAGETSYAWSITNGIIIGSTTSQSITYTAGASGTVGLQLNVVEPGGCRKSASTSITINPTPPTPNISGTLAFCTGGNTTLTSGAPGGNQWYVGGNPIAGETNQNLLVTAAGSYTVQVTDGNGCLSAMSAAAVVTVSSPPPTPTIAGTTNGTGTQDQACPEQPLTLTANGATGATSYQWYQDNNTLNGETSSTYQATGVGTYYVTATANGCTSVQSVGYVVQNPTPHSPFISFRNQDSSVTTLAICQGSSQIIDSDSATGIQWYKDGVAIAGGNSQSYTATQAGVYTAQLNALGCHSQFGRNVTLTVDAMPPTPTISGDTNATGTQDQACPEQPLTLHANGATGATSYTWYSDNAVIPNESTSTLIMTGVGNISVTATNGTCTTPHSATYVVQNPTPHSPFISFRGQNSSVTTLTICGTSQIIDSDSATGIQWYKDGIAIPGAGSQSYTATQSGVYTAQLNALGCHSQFGRNVTLTINPLPATPTATPGGPTTFCAGGSVTLTSNSASGNQWYLNGNSIGGATNSTYSATASGSYTVKVTDGNSCTSAASNAVVVTVNPIPATPTISGGPTTFCAGGSVTLTSSSASGNQWYLNANPIGGQTNQTYVATAAGNYTVIVTASGCSSAASAATIVTVNPNPNATITAPASAVTGSTGNIASVANAGVGATYNWSITNGTITAGTGTNSITFTAGAVGTLTLNVTVTTSAGCSDTKSASVNVVVPPVTVTSVSPTGGTIAGGSAVTINGTGFASGATVTFGGSAATNVVVVSAVKITARTPAHALGAVNVTVTNVDTSNGTLTSGYLYKAQQFDPNNDGTITSSDIFYLVNYLFLGGPPPSGAAGVLSGDANGDGVVNASDIFFLVNYLFLGGPRPNAVPTLTPVTRLSRTSETRAIEGSISLGKPVLRDGRHIVPVIMTIGPDSITPQSMALRVHFEADGNMRNVSVRRAGVAKDLAVPFEISRNMDNDLSYLVSYAVLNLGQGRSAVVAEIEIDSLEGSLNISVDPQLTMLGDQAGQMPATVANGKLQVKGATIGTMPVRPNAPGHEVN